jgi:hypothetical protein
MDGPIVHPRITREHPQLSAEDVRYAWEHSYYEALRPESPNFPEYLWIGRDKLGREVEMVGTMTTQGWLIYHANTPVSKRVKAEVKRKERRE